MSDVSHGLSQIQNTVASNVKITEPPTLTSAYVEPAFDSSVSNEIVPGQDSQSGDTWNVFYRSLDDWMGALQGPDAKIFYRDAQFGPEQFAYFFRILLPSIAIAAAEFGISKLAKVPRTLDNEMLYLQVLACFAYVGFLFKFYSRLFGIRLTLRQAFFCFAIAATPWLPMIGALRLVTPAIGVPLYLLSLWGMSLNVLWAVSCAIRRVTGKSQLHVFSCILLGVFLVILCNISTEIPAIKKQIAAARGQAQTPPAAAANPPKPAAVR